MKVIYSSIFACVGVFGSLIGCEKDSSISKSSPFEINTFEDYQRLSDLKDKIELLELIEDRLVPLTDDEILDSKMHDLKLFYQGIKEMEGSYDEVRAALNKYSQHNNPDIQNLSQGAINFLDAQGKILSLISELIEENPKAKSLNELPVANMGKLEFLIFKIKTSYQVENFIEAQKKAWEEISIYTNAYSSDSSNE